MQRHAAPIALAVLALATAMVLAACGSSSPARSSTLSGSGSSPGSAQMHDDAVRFAVCMRADGVPSFPDPAGNGIGIVGAIMKASNGSPISVNGVSVNSPAFRSAMANCHQYLPQPAAPTPTQRARMQALMLTWARCMRAHGFHMSDPVITADGHRQWTGGSTDSPVYHTARNACDPQLRRPMSAAGL